MPHERKIMIAPEPFGYGYDVVVQPPVDGESLGAEYPTYREARLYAEGLRKDRGWCIVDGIEGEATGGGYPGSPGHRGIETSVAAAESIAPSVGRLQRLVLNAVSAAGPIGRSTNEIADLLDVDRGSIQPRTSELRSKRLIVDSGRRRPNASGKRAIVWTLPEHADSRRESA